jgi:hypothetical protein
MEDTYIYLHGELTEAERNDFKTHLAFCWDCSKRVKEFKGRDRLLHALSTLELKERRKAEKVSMGRLSAALAYDSWEEPVRLGVRPDPAGPRCLLFIADDIDLEVDIECSEIDDRITLVASCYPPR